MHPLALWSEEHEQLDWLRVRAAEPVRGVGVELRGLAGDQLEVELGVIHCPYCHGWEVCDRRIGVLATARWPCTRH